MGVKWRRIVIALSLAISFIVPVYAFAGADDLAKQADKIIRDAERKMHSGENLEADALLNEAAGLIEQGKEEDPSNSKIMRTEKKFERIRKNVDKKLGKTQVQPSSSGSAKISEGDKLPAGVKKRLKDITRILNNAEPYVGSDAETAMYKLRQAEQLFGEIEKSYGGQFDPDHSDFTVVQNRFKELTAQTALQKAAEDKATAASAESDAAKEKQSAEWIVKFYEYLSYPGQEGYNPDKLVFVPGTSEPEKFAEAQKRYQDFKAFYEEYGRTDFPHGKTWKLEDLADNEAPRRLKNFEEGFAGNIAAVLGNAEKEIDAAMRQLEKDDGWKTDKTLKPNLVDRKWMTSIREATRNAVTALEESDPKRKEIQAKFDVLEAKDKKNREIRKERTFMTPDCYTGGEIDELKKKAESLVKEDRKEGGEPVRSTIISENWQEQTVEEWTDTSKTAWRRRTTRSITGQVAARTADGVRLITVTLSQDKQNDGSWSPLYGNLHQYSDPMLESNVNK